ncbi:MAG TPA: hypothetical protein VFN02_13410 [Ktedonobacteraceae bacterium]|nr:hypothetical protein [Ktedonobacteraceae bacterium]
MDCLYPLAPDDEELLRFALDGEAVSEEVRRHLEQCTTCQQRLARYKKAHSFLVSHLYRSQCPSGTELSLYCAGFLPEDQRITIANHILDCPLCAAEAEDTRQFLAETVDLLPSDPLPLHALNGFVRRIFATLVRQQAQLVVRGDTDPAAWPRQYRADSTDLSLHLSRASSGAFMLLGILTDPRESIEAFKGTLAELYPAAGGKNASRAEKPLLSEQVDDLGNIVFNAVPVGEYVMIVHLPGREMIVEGLTIESG